MIALLLNYSLFWKKNQIFLKVLAISMSVSCKIFIKHLHTFIKHFNLRSKQFLKQMIKIPVFFLLIALNSYFSIDYKRGLGRMELLTWWLYCWIILLFGFRNLLSILVYYQFPDQSINSRLTGKLLIKNCFVFFDWYITVPCNSIAEGCPCPCYWRVGIGGS